MTNQSQQLYNILTLFNHLSFEERLIVLKELVARLDKPKTSPKPKISLLSLAGTGQGIYGDIDAYIANERDWD